MKRIILILLALTSTIVVYGTGITQLGEENFGVAYDIDYSGDTIYVTGNHGVEVIDISDRSNPDTIKRLTTAEGCFGIEIQGDRLYVAGITNGFQIYDITEPNDPQLLGTHPITALSLTVDGTHAYVLSGEMWAIIDVTDPMNPTTVSQTYTDNTNYRTHMIDDTLYIGEHGEGLNVYDVTDPQNPEHIRVIPNTDGVFDLTTQGDTLYIACHGNGVKSLDITDRQNPRILDTYRDGGEAYGGHIVGNTLLVADLQEGIKLLDISDPADITLIAAFTGTTPHGVTGDQNYIYLADQDHGLEVFQYGEGINTVPEAANETSNRIPLPAIATMAGILLFATLRKKTNPA